MAAIDGISPVTPAANINRVLGAGVYRRDAVAAPAQRPLPNTNPDAGVTDAREALSIPRQDGGDIQQLVSEANARLETSNRSMRFRIADDSGDIQIQIVDRERDRVIRSIPSDEMLHLSSRMREMFGVGSMVDTAH